MTLLLGSVKRIGPEQGRQDDPMQDANSQ